MKKIVMSLFAGLFIASSFAMQSKEQKDLENIKKVQASEVLVFYECSKETTKVAPKNNFNVVKDNDNRRWLKDKINRNKPVVIKPLKTVY